MKIIKRRNERVVDVHIHILPGVDDGSQDMEETLAMLQKAYAEGITDIIATPHHKSGRHNASLRTIQRLTEQVQECANQNNIPIQIYPGNEVLYYSDMEDSLEDHRICTMNNTEYVLLEFSPGDRFTYIRNAVDSVFGMGYQPIIAHVERYECMVRHPEYVTELKQMGAGIQINAGSITGETGWKVKRLAHKLLQRRLVDYVGTDAHSCKGRTPSISKCADLLYKKFDSDYADAILYGNAEKNLLGGEG